MGWRSTAVVAAPADFVVSSLPFSRLIDRLPLNVKKVFSLALNSVETYNFPQAVSFILPHLVLASVVWVDYSRHTGSEYITKVSVESDRPTTLCHSPSGLSTCTTLVSILGFCFQFREILVNTFNMQISAAGKRITSLFKSSI